MSKDQKRGFIYSDIGISIQYITQVFDWYTTEETIVLDCRVSLVRGKDGKTVYHPTRLEISRSYIEAIELGYFAYIKDGLCGFFVSREEITDITFGPFNLHDYVKIPILSFEKFGLVECEL